MTNKIAARFSMAENDKEAKILQTYLDRACPFKNAMCAMIQYGKWEDLLKIRDNWSTIWLQALSEAYEIEPAPWLEKAINCLELRIGRKC